MIEPERRLREIKIRLTESEHQALLDRSSRPSLATWIRETCLATEVSPRSLVIKTDPNLLRQLSGIGNNLNQIARIVNQQTKSTSPKCALTVFSNTQKKRQQGVAGV